MRAGWRQATSRVIRLAMNRGRRPAAYSLSNHAVHLRAVRLAAGYGVQGPSYKKCAGPHVGPYNGPTPALFKAFSAASRHTSEHRKGQRRGESDPALSGRP
jgi:hypothetical protein